MTSDRERPGAAAGLSFALDRFAMNIHGDADSHLDALSHVIFDGTLYNGVSAGAITAAGATELSIEARRRRDRRPRPAARHPAAAGRALAGARRSRDGG